MGPRRLIADRRGSVVVVTALGMTTMMAVAAIAVDLGAMVLARRRAQGAVDIAATMAAVNPASAGTLARQALNDNGYGDAQAAIVAGAYSAESRIAVGSRFVAGGTPANAVRVTLQATAPTYFAPALGLARNVGIEVQGTAASAQFAAFTIGSGLASLDSGIANAVLGAMLGRRLSLSAMDYNALLTTRIDAYRFLDALAPALNLQAASYSDIVKASATAGQIAAALQVAAGGTANAAPAAAALGQISGSLQGAGGTIRIGDIVDLGDAASLSPGPGTRGQDINLMETLSDLASVSNGQRQVSVDLGPSIPGLLGTRITLGVGEKRQSSGYVQPGNPRATVNTAQTRLLIEASLGLPLGLGSLTLPIYVQAAQARGTLRTVTCPWSDQNRRQVVVDAQTGLADLAIADVPRPLIDPNAAAPDLGKAVTLLQVTPLLSVSGNARLPAGNPYAQSVTFNDDDIARHTVKTVGTYGLAQPTATNLIRSLDVKVNGSGLLGADLIRNTVTTALSAAAPALDGVLSSTLRTLGLRIGTADLSVDGMRCDQAVLVQ